MKQRAIKIAVTWCGMVVVVALVVSRESSIDSRLRILSANYATLSRMTEANAKRCDDLATEASKWRGRAEQAQSQATQRQESRHKLAASAHAWANDALDFDNEARIARPALIISALPGGEETMRRNFEETNRYDGQVATSFLKIFGGRLSGLARKARPYGVDTSRLQHHLAVIQSPIVIRLIVNDVNDIADQLEPAVIQRPNPEPAPEPGVEPRVRSTAARLE